MKQAISFFLVAILSILIALFTILGGFAQLFRTVDPLAEVFIFSLSFATACITSWAGTRELTQTLRSREAKARSW
jgi:hypothetical protein